MARVENLTHEELGAVLVVCGLIMMEAGLYVGAALDGESSGYIRAELATLLEDHDDDRLDELACIDSAQALAAMNGDEPVEMPE